MIKVTFSDNSYCIVHHREDKDTHFGNGMAEMALGSLKMLQMQDSSEQGKVELIDKWYKIEIKEIIK